MDLLYCLQNIRLLCPDWLISLIALLSDSTLLVAPAIPCCIYWAVNKKKGTYMVCALCTAFLLNELIKVSCCIYRPWILDTRLTPAVQAIGTATNYSFPSSHSCAIAVVCIAMIMAFPKNKARTVIAILSVLLVMFSRMFLGCHTLKDVCVGAFTGTCVALLFRPMLSDNFNEDRFTKMLLPAALVISVLSIIYILTKDYPVDYDSAGNIVVDPANMIPDTIGGCGMVLGAGIGLYLERKYVGFPMPTGKKQAVLWALGGAFIFALFYAVVTKKLFGELNRSAFKFIRFAICAVIALAAYPALFDLNGRLNSRQNN